MHEEIHGCNSRVTMQECHAVKETRGLKPGGVSNVCHCCGEAGHFARKCKFQCSKCFKYRKQGHLAKVCKHPQKLGKSQKQRPQNSCKDHKLYADGIYAVKERAHKCYVASCYSPASVAIPFVVLTIPYHNRVQLLLLIQLPCTETKIPLGQPNAGSQEDGRVGRMQADQSTTNIRSFYSTTNNQRS
ncbi:hypothetical protein T12_11860 [Trichinella patagoniensis]|uniref:CCHC-type domain-containing protein n=1 Tax=Trichinella patagoniensis TaxID=990121 RepID=A0A0V0ZWW4_9BILA|nr:hypothetical protein T12_11860 [Trichinella patagoniensis]